MTYSINLKSLVRTAEDSWDKSPWILSSSVVVMSMKEIDDEGHSHYS